LKNKKFIFKEFLGYLIIAIIAALFSVTLRIFIIEPFIVPTPSMAPTLLVGDKVIVNKLEYKIHTIKRGDIVVFHSPTEKKDLVKRAIAFEGEEITLNKNGEIFIDGKKLSEPYLPKDIIISYEDQKFKIDKNQLYVMGDNRNNSADSRVFGPISLDQIFGKVIFIYGPFNRMGKPK
jgi:signal peptidase I